MQYLKTILNTKTTPQSEAIPGTLQVANSAGGYAFAVDDWTRLERFLILGTEAGSYYATERTLTLENADAVRRCIETDGSRAVHTIAEISRAGRAPKNDPALFALAMAATFGDVQTRREALAALSQVARIGTHLFHFAAYIDGMRGWGRGLRGAVGRWYEGQSVENLAYQAVKYGQRDGWSHRDLLRLSHPKPTTEGHTALYHWITQGWPGVGELPHPDADLRLVWAAERIQRMETAMEAARLIREYRLPREAVPTQWLSSPEVWEALLTEMPIAALLRNLATLTRVGLLTPGSETAGQVLDRLANGERLRAARVHPIAVLSALMTYRQGHGERGQNRWQPVAPVVDALDAAFYAAFGSITTTGKRWLLALDVSGSMDGGQVAGVSGLTPRIASAAMALVTAATETQQTMVAFTASAAGVMGGRWGGGTPGLTPLAITPRQRLDDVVGAMRALPMGGTDCALPMLWAMENSVPVDVFVVYTDSETWAGTIHPVLALRQYRDRTGIAAKLIVVGMVSNGFTLADPDDAGMLDVVGFDTAAPQLMARFAGS